jgi:hypothetical protein
MAKKLIDFVAKKIAHVDYGELGNLIRRHGWHSLCVIPDADEPDVPWEYTIGLTEIGLPELILFGMPYRQSHPVLHGAVEQMQAHGRPADDWRSQGVILGFEVSFRALPAFVLTEFACQAAYYYEGSPYTVDVMQVVWPDKAGLFPWDAGCNADYARRQSQITHWVEVDRG